MRFMSPYNSFIDTNFTTHRCADYNGQEAILIYRHVEGGIDSYCIRFSDGVECEAFPEELVFSPEKSEA